MEKFEKITRENPYDKAFFLSKWFFSWMIPVYNKGFKRDLELTDMYKCCKIDVPKLNADKLQVEWDKELAKRESSSSQSKYKPSIIKAIVRAFWIRYLLYTQICVWGEIGLRLWQPFLVGNIVNYLSQAKDEESILFDQDQDNDLIDQKEKLSIVTFDTAFYSAIGLIVTSTIFAFSRHPSFVLTQRVTNNIRSALTVMIYRKLLKLSKSSFETTDVGNILNVIANDLNRFEDVGWQLPYLFIGPIMGAVVIYVSYTYLGIACLGGLIILLLFIPFQGLMGRLFQLFRRRTTKLTDTRVRTMGEIISAMKLIKFYCWESSFAQAVAEIRELEVQTIRKSAYLRGVNNAMFFVATRCMLFASFIVYVLQGNRLDATTVFVIMSLFNSIRIPITSSLPQAIGTGAETLVACARVQKLLLLEERSERPQSIESRNQPQEQKGTLNLKNFSCKWTKNMNTESLKNINFQVNPGELVVVIGPVGAGKTCLLHSILNETETTSGSLTLNGKLSYAPQESWCFTGTIKENILLCSSFDQVKYDQVVKCCGLERDMKLFPNGEDTFVGEKGYSLSGGQKARVTLARAVYNDGDVYLLDDPLSAVDPKVANTIFDKCIKGYLKNKTTVLVTHQLQFIQRADKIIVLNEGSVTGSGSYDELMSQNVDFLQFLEKQKQEEAKRKETLEKQKSLSISGDVTCDLSKSDSITRRSASKTSSLKVESELDYEEEEVGKGMTREETKDVGSVNPKVYWKYFRSGASIWFIIAVSVWALCTQAVFHFTDLWLADWTNKFEDIVDPNCTDTVISIDTPVITPVTTFTNNVTKCGFIKPDVGDQTNNAILYSVLVAVLFVSAFIRTISVFHLCLRCSSRLHDIIFTRVLRAPMLFFENNPLGRILNRFTRDVGIVDQVIPNSVAELQMNLINVLGIVVVSVIVNQWLIIPCVILAILSYPVRLYYIRTGRDVQRLDSIARSPVYTHISATFDGLTTVRAFGLEQMFEEQYLRYMNDSVACRWMVFCSSRIIGLILDGFANVYIAAIAIMLITVPHGTIKGGEAGLILSSALILIGMFQYGVRLTAEFETQMVSTERVLEYGQLEQEADLRIENKAINVKWPQHGSLQFKNVTLRYSKSLPPVLKNISFEVNGGEKIGIVGRTGAGKSSLISVLFRLVEPEGNIVIDNLDTKTLGLHELREKISIIPQDPTLFSGTVRKNLDPFDMYQDKDLWQALTSAKLDVAVKSMPGMLNALVTEGGSNLSVGQRQLLCLSRALLKKNKILVLDEATANVDHETDELIQATIKTEFCNCTVLTVAHRLNTIIDMDRVLVLDAGTLVEFDEPFVLLQNSNGFFHSMVKQTGPEFEKMLHKMAESSFKVSKRRALDHHQPLTLKQLAKIEDGLMSD